MLNLKPRTNGWATYSTFLLTVLSPYVLQGMAGIPLPLAQLSSSEAQLPFPMYHFGYGTLLAQAAPLGQQLLFALPFSFSHGPFQSGRVHSGLSQMSLILTIISLFKLSLTPYLGTIMSFPFYFFFFSCSVVVYSNSDALLDLFACVKYILILKKHVMCVSVCLHWRLCTTTCMQCPWRLEEDVQSPGSGVTDRWLWTTIHLGTGYVTGVLGKSSQCCLLSCPSSPKGASILLRVFEYIRTKDTDV